MYDDNGGVIDNNMVTLTGKVVGEPEFSHEVFGEGFYIVNLEVPRLSRAFDILPITVSERIMDRGAFSMNNYINVNGQIRSYNSYIENEKRNKLIITVFAKDYEAYGDYALINPVQGGNEVFLNGFICKPPMYRTTPFGREIADLLVAVNRSYNKSDYVPCITWGRNARFCGRLSVSDNIKLWGRLQSPVYQKKYDDGSVVDKVAYEVSASKIEINEREDI